MKKLILLLSALLLCLLLVLASLYPIEVKGVRRRVEEGASRAIQGRVKVKEAYLYLAPLPRLELRGVRAEGAGVEFVLQVAVLRPRLWPLLRGEVRLEDLKVKGLRLVASLKGGKRGLGVPPAEEVSLEHGRIDLLLPSGRRLKVSLLQAHMALRDGSLTGRAEGDAFGIDPLGVKGGAFSAEFSWSRGRWRAGGRAVVLHPRAKLTFKGLCEDGWRFELRARGIDVAGVRQVLLKVWPGGKKVLEIVRGGELVVFEAVASGETLKEALAFRSLHIKGRVRDGSLTVPLGPLPLEDLQGEFEIEGGVLSARADKARLRGSTAEGGFIKVPLVGRGQMGLRARVRAKVEDLLVYLPRLIKEGGLERLLRDLRGSEGEVLGELGVQGESSRPEVKVRLEGMALALRHRLMPWPLMVEGGRGEATAEGMALEGLKVKGPKSTLQGVSLRVGFPEGRLLAEGRGQVAMEDLMALRGVLPLEGLELDGEVEVRRFRAVLALKPVLLRELSVEGVPDVTVRHRLLPAPLGVAGGTLSIGGDGLAFSEVEFRLGESQGRFSGRLEGFPSVEAVELGGRATVHRRVARWLEGLVKLPVRLRTPYGFEGTVQVGKGWKVDCSLSFPKGRKVVLRGSGGRDVLSLEEVRLGGKATLSLRHAPGGLSLAFRGGVTGEDLGAVLEGDFPPRASLRGDLLVRADRHRRELKGWFEVREFPLSLRDLPLVVVEDLKARGAGPGTLVVDSALLKVGVGVVKGRGSVVLRGGGAELDLVLRAEGLDLSPWQKLFKGEKGRRPPVTGRIRWRAGGFRLGRWALEDSSGVVLLEKGGVTVRLQRGSLCGVEVEGTLSSLRGVKAIKLNMAAAEAPLGEILRCLGVKEGLADGELLLEADLEARGRKDPLRESSRGSLYLFSAEGKIYRLTALSRLFALLNVMEVLKGRFPDFTGRGFPYDRLEVVGQLKDGLLRIEEGVLESPGLKLFAEGTVDLPTGRLDMVALVAPLRTVDTLLDRVPLLGHLLTGKSGTFLSFPFKVQGTISAPEITPLPPSAIGRGILGVMKRTLELPFRVIEPVLP